MTKRYGDITIKVGKSWVRLGTILQTEENDPNKGPGLIIALDPWINLAELPHEEGESVYASVYWPKEPK